ncbi:MAG: hypothetical protein ABH952_09765 [Candidatus Omnitrophota bacterium]
MRRLKEKIENKIKAARENLARRPLTSSEKAFTKVNAAFWSQYLNDKPQQQPVRYVLIEENNHPIIFLCNSSLAAIVKHARNLKPLFLLSQRNNAIEKILESYHPNNSFVYVKSWRYLIPRLAAYIQAIKAFCRLGSPNDILDFAADGIRFGDLIYDAVLAKGYATISRLNMKVFDTLSAFFFYRYLAKDIIKKYDIEIAVFSHTIGLKSGTFTRYLLQHKIEVVNRVGSHQIILKKYRSLDDVGFYPLRPEQKYFVFMRDQCSDVVLKMADKYLHDRFSQNVDHVAVDIAFNQNKRIFNSRNEFCQHFSLNPDKKLIFVMLHAFNDQPHSHFASRMIFRDYYDWFEKTLDITTSVDSVNWIFKEHPAAEFYPTRDVDLDKIFQCVSNSHIRFLNRKADFNASSLQCLASAIVTCIGTAGLEYSCMGIPSILAGESPYSTFGFTINPQNIHEYEEQLRNIYKLRRLNNKEIRAAKIVLFFQLNIMIDSPYIFCPKYDYRQIKEIHADDLWRDTVELIQNTDKKTLQLQIDTLTDFINDPDYTQYINLDKYGFMRGAVYENQG